MAHLHRQIERAREEGRREEHAVAARTMGGKLLSIFVGEGSMKRTTFGVNAVTPAPRVGVLASVCHHHPTLQAARRCEQKRSLGTTSTTS